MLGTSLHANYCEQTITLETAEIMQELFDHCKLLRHMNYCMNYCMSKQLLQRHPLRNTPLLRTPKPSLKGSNEDEKFITKSTAEFTAKVPPTICAKIHRFLLPSGSGDPFLMCCFPPSSGWQINSCVSDRVKLIET